MALLYIIKFVASCSTVVQKGRSADRNRMSKSTLDKGVPGRLNPIVCPIHKIVLERLVAGGAVLPPSPDGSVFINDIKVLRLSHMWHSRAVLVTMVVEGWVCCMRYSVL